jgi:cysteinyl-tRNA synthetase
MFGWFSKAPSAAITLHNTATRSNELFTPIQKGVVKMYACGPTVYSTPHIGNLRAALIPDIVRRAFEYAGYKVIEVMNITDFGHLVGDADDGDDKMTVGLKREGLELTMENMFLLASRYIELFKEDFQSMNIKPPHAMPRASEHVKGMIAYVEVLMHKGYAYKISDGIYFDVAKFPHYGVLGGNGAGESRIGVNVEKHDPRDFTLWKFDEHLGWDSPWGKGFPGWHIECTAMSTQYLGKSFDIHTGGIDHIAIHHNNEIAQAEAANNKPYARYWLHNEFITIDNTKFSKSLGNEVVLRQLRDRGVSPLAYRYWLLTGHYRQSMNFTWEAVTGAQQALYRALRIFADLRGSGSVVPVYKTKFETAIYDDLDTPKAIATLWELIKDESVSAGDKRATILDFDRVLGVGFSLTEDERGVIGSQVVDKAAVPADIQALIDERVAARAAKDFARADELREALRQKGFVVEDTPTGPSLSRVG